ncbi:hypothetical protein [Robiginitalea aurantiaca]|uniref:Uncharacterized protein n=1 Tax=Robiginitalea aurantiaca TaxID=3056915 RepID=A0ABT7WCR7_9FLAO|nr:hypothetical protein [Robiginitalea aurantiaca]MDM9630710.1 hypothetical protein [Robiginitalea aurantiaca]
MNTKGASPLESEGNRDRLLAMERDLQFLYFLVKAPVYQKQRPNLYERLMEYADQAGELEEELRRLDSGSKGELEVFEKKCNLWKSGLYEFLESIL